MTAARGPADSLAASRPAAVSRRPSTLRSLAAALLALAVVPAVAFVAFEVRLARDSEQALAVIRDEQLDALLFSVNQHAWDVTNAWAARLQAVPGISRPGDDYAIRYETWVGIRALFRAVPAVETVLSFDTALAEGGAATFRDDGAATAAAFRAAYSAGRARRHVERRALGYRQLDPVSLPGGRLALAFAVDAAEDARAAGTAPRLVALVVAPGPFVDYVVMPKLREVSRGGLVLGVFADTARTPLAATGALRAPRGRDGAAARGLRVQRVARTADAARATGARRRAGRSREARRRG